MLAPVTPWSESEEVQNALYIASVHAEADKDGNKHDWYDDSCRDDECVSERRVK